MADAEYLAVEGAAARDEKLGQVGIELLALFRDLQAVGAAPRREIGAVDRALAAERELVAQIGIERAGDLVAQRLDVGAVALRQVGEAGIPVVLDRELVDAGLEPRVRGR